MASSEMRIIPFSGKSPRSLAEICSGLRARAHLRAHLRAWRGPWPRFLHAVRGPSGGVPPGRAIRPARRSSTERRRM